MANDGGVTGVGLPRYRRRDDSVAWYNGETRVELRERLKKLGLWGHFCEARKRVMMEKKGYGTHRATKILCVKEPYVLGGRNVIAPDPAPPELVSNPGPGVGPVQVKESASVRGECSGGSVTEDLSMGDRTEEIGDFAEESGAVREVNTEARGEGMIEAAEQRIADVRGKTVSPLKAIRWVFVHLDVVDVNAADAPPGAWSLLCWARQSADTRKEFYKTYVPRMLPARTEIERDESRRNAATDLTATIEKLQRFAAGA